MATIDGCAFISNVYVAANGLSVCIRCDGYERDEN